MPRIPEYNAPPVTLHPDQEGSAAWARAGTIAQHYGTQTRAILDREGEQIASGIESFKPLADQAQEHTDMMAQAQYYSDSAQNQVLFNQTLEQGGSPTKTADGSISSVPSAGQYATVADNVLQQHQQFTQDAIDRARASGASQKTVDRLTVHAAQQTGRLTLQAHAVEHQRQVAELTHNYDKTVASLTAPLYDHPTGLQDALDQHEEILGTFGNSKSEQRIALGPRSIADKEAMIATAAMGWANIGQPERGKAIIHDPQYADIVGKHIPQLERAIDGVISEKRTALNGAQKDAAIAATGAYVADALSDHPTKTLIDLANDAALKNRPDLLKTAAETVKTMKQLKAGELQVPADTTHNSMYGENGIMKRIYAPSGDPLKITDRTAIDQMLIDHQIDEKAHGFAIQQLDQLNKNPAIREASTAGKEWLRRNEGSIDTAFAKGTGTLPEGRSQLGQQRVTEWETEFNRRIQAGEKYQDLLNPAKAGSMADSNTLANYRTTLKQEQDFKKQQTDLEAKANQSRAVGSPAPVTTPAATPTTKGPDALGRTGGPGARIDVPATMSLLTAEGRAAGVTQMLKQYQPGTKVVVAGKEYTIPPAGTTFQVDGKTYTVPGATENPLAPKKMNYAPDSGNAASGAINASLAAGVDAHSDKNLFSSGRAAELGVKGGIGENLTTISAQGHSIRVNAEAAPHFKGFLDELESMGYKISDVGGYSDRMKRGGSSMSEHAYGNAIDINPDKNQFHSSKNDLPPNVAQIAAKYGLIWGGNWTGRSRDPMHFEWSGKGGTQVAGR